MRGHRPAPERCGLLGATSALMLAGMACFAAPASGQGRTGVDSIRPIPLDSLTATVTRGTMPLERMPAATARIVRSILQGAQLTVGLDESLDRVPGVFVNNRYNFSLGARISIRGFGARAAFGVRGIRVIADGIPLTMPDGQSNLNNLDLGAAERVEILRGPSSALYGNAAGGVIAVTTESPPLAPFGVEARVMGGDAGREGEFGRVSKLQAKAGGTGGRANWFVSLSHMSTDGFRDFSRAEQTLLNATARLALDAASSLAFVVNAVNAPVAESPGALPLDSARLRPRIAWPNNVRTGSGEATHQAQAGLAYSRIIGAGRFDLAGWGLARDVDNALPFAFIFLERRGGGMRASWSGLPAGSGSDFSLTAGLDAEFARDDRREFNNVSGEAGPTVQRDQAERVLALGPFVQASMRLSPSVEVTLGTRYDAVRFETEDRFSGDGRDDSGKRTLSAFSRMLGVTWSAASDVRLYANYATAFQTPTTTELINAPPPAGQPCCPGGFNAVLDPQHARSAEIGARGRLGRVNLDVALYHMNVENTVVPFQVEGEEGREFFRNAGETRHRGLELAASSPIGQHAIEVAYTLNDFVFVDDGSLGTDFEENRLPGVPRHNIFAGIQLNAADRLRFDFELQHIGEQATEDGNDPAFANEAATVMDARLLYRARIGDWLATPFIALNNVTDTRYNASVVVNAVGRRYFEPAPGRNLYLGVTLGSPGWTAAR